MQTAATTRPLTDNPFLAGHGPVEASTCTALSVVPEIIHDVNGYYRDLGVHPSATRKQLRLAYVANGGPDDARLTYVFRQLLNPAVRYEYDRMPLGSRFLDRYVLDEMHNKMVMAARARQQEMREQGLRVPDEDSLIRDFYARMGFDENDFPDLDTPDSSDVLDPALSRQHDRDRNKVFPWSYYLWRVHARTGEAGERDLRRLAQWQELLVGALARKGVTTKIAVGLLGRMAHPWASAVVGYRVVVFLNRDEEPTAELAERAADRVHDLMPHISPN